MDERKISDALGTTYERMRDQFDFLHDVHCRTLALLEAAKEADPRFASLFQKHLAEVENRNKKADASFRRQLDRAILELKSRGI